MRNTATILALAVTSLLAQSPSSYQVTHTWLLGGDGSWDYSSLCPIRPIIASLSRGRTA